MFQDTTLMNESTSLIAIEQFLEDVYNEYYIHDDEEFKHQLIEAVLVFKLVHREDLTYCHVVRIMKRVLILVENIRTLLRNLLSCIGNKRCLIVLMMQGN